MLKIDRSKSEQNVVRFADLKRGELFTIDRCKTSNLSEDLFIFVKSAPPTWHGALASANSLNATCLDDGEMIFVDENSRVNRVEANLTISKGKVKD